MAIKKTKCLTLNCTRRNGTRWNFSGTSAAGRAGDDDHLDEADNDKSVDDFDNCLVCRVVSS